MTDFISSHPGGPRVILRLAGLDATEEFDPVHPPGTLEEHLKPEAKLGPVDPASLQRLKDAKAQADQKDGGSKTKGEVEPRAPPLESLLNMDDFEEVATRLVPKKAWAYYYSAADDLFSKHINTTAYRQILLRPRIFIDITSCSLSTTLLGYKVGLPLYVAPAAMARLAHPDGEAGIAKGISRFGALQIVSHNASMTPEQIVADAQEGQIFGWQIYVQTDRRKSEASEYCPTRQLSNVFQVVDSLQCWHASTN